jgi:hypothetical protein
LADATPLPVLPRTGPGQLVEVLTTERNSVPRRPLGGAAGSPAAHPLVPASPCRRRWGAAYRGQDQPAPTREGGVCSRACRGWGRWSRSPPWLRGRSSASCVPGSRRRPLSPPACGRCSQSSTPWSGVAPPGGLSGVSRSVDFQDRCNNLRISCGHNGLTDPNSTIRLSARGGQRRVGPGARRARQLPTLDTRPAPAQ